MPFGIAFLVLAILSVIMPFLCDNEKQKGYTPEIDENTGELRF